jgi:hypothetical protein
VLGSPRLETSMSDQTTRRAFVKTAGSADLGAGERRSGM